MSNLDQGLVKELQCVALPCPYGYSELALDSFEPWLGLFRILHSETIRETGLGLTVLNLTESVDAEVFEFIATVDGVIAEVREEQRKQAAQS